MLSGILHETEIVWQVKRRDGVKRPLSKAAWCYRVNQNRTLLSRLIARGFRASDTSKSPFRTCKHCENTSDKNKCIREWLCCFRVQKSFGTGLLPRLKKNIKVTELNRKWSDVWYNSKKHLAAQEWGNGLTGWGELAYWMTIKGSGLIQIYQAPPAGNSWTGEPPGCCCCWSNTTYFFYLIMMDWKSFSWFDDDLMSWGNWQTRHWHSAPSWPGTVATPETVSFRPSSDDIFFGLFRSIVQE